MSSNLDSIPVRRRWWRIAGTALGMVGLAVLTRIPLPGVDLHALVLALNTGQNHWLWSWADLLSGGGVSRASIAALGLVPFVSAHLVRVAIARVVRSFDLRWTLGFTVTVAAVQSAVFAQVLSAMPGVVQGSRVLFLLSATVLLTGASALAVAVSQSVVSLTSNAHFSGLSQLLRGRVGQSQASAIRIGTPH